MQFYLPLPREDLHCTEMLLASVQKVPVLSYSNIPFSWPAVSPFSWLPVCISANPIIAIAVLLFYSAQGFVTRSSRCPAIPHLVTITTAVAEELCPPFATSPPQAASGPTLNRLSTINFVNVIKRHSQSTGTGRLVVRLSL